MEKTQEFTVIRFSIGLKDIKDKGIDIDKITNISLNGNGSIIFVEGHKNR